MKISIHSLEKTLYEGSGKVVSLPSSEGEISILDHHIPLITILKKGKIKIKDEKESHDFPIESGFAEVSGEKVTILIK